MKAFSFNSELHSKRADIASFFKVRNFRIFILELIFLFKSDCLQEMPVAEDLAARERFAESLIRTSYISRPGLASRASLVCRDPSMSVPMEPTQTVRPLEVSKCYEICRNTETSVLT